MFNLLCLAGSWALTAGKSVVQRSPWVIRRGLAYDFDVHGVAHIENFLSPRVFRELQREARGFVAQLQPETVEAVAKGRWGMYLSPGSTTSRVLRSADVRDALRRVTGRDLEASDFPVELRRYPLHSSMDWHHDEPIYEEPQVELVYTLDNDTDSETQWETRDGRIVSRFMRPNSLLVVEADGVKHRVTPVTRGNRMIVKFAYTSCREKLPSWYDNLDAYSSSSSLCAPE